MWLRRIEGVARTSQRRRRMMLEPALSLLGCLTQLGCLVTGSPDFSDPTPTPPLLLEEPTRRTSEVVYFQKVGNNYDAHDFRAFVVSEDAGQPVKAVLFLDYGRIGTNNTPYVDDEPLSALPAGTLADGPRLLGKSWRPRGTEEPGCHTVTLLATHEFAGDLGVPEDEYPFYCPADLADSSTLTWFVSFCLEGEEGGVGPNCSLENCPSGESQPPLVYCDDLAAAAQENVAEP